MAAPAPNPPKFRHSAHANHVPADCRSAGSQVLACRSRHDYGCRFAPTEPPAFCIEKTVISRVLICRSVNTRPLSHWVGLRCRRPGPHRFMGGGACCPARAPSNDGTSFSRLSSGHHHPSPACLVNWDLD
jgi:hypothetical protein